ncbi:MAG: PilZ domain-containing protein, partial [Desulfobulbaceae bacterium]|nr:PilZ domain-containing protein [Desulfobulbaceae bacterium]
MLNAMIGTERRRDQRFAVRERAIAVLKAGASFTKLGQVVDISRGGLAFDYVLLDAVDPDALSGAEVEVPMVLNILTEDGFMALQGAGIQTVSDRSLANDRSFSTVQTRRCSVRFRDLTPVQR